MTSSRSKAEHSYPLHVPDNLGPNNHSCNSNLINSLALDPELNLVDHLVYWSILNAKALYPSFAWIIDSLVFVGSRHD